MERDGPILVVGHHAVGERALGRGVGQARETRDREEVAAVGPEREARAQVLHRGLARRHLGDEVDAVRAVLQRVGGLDRGLAKVARGAHHHLVGGLAHHLDRLRLARPGRPVVGDEVGEGDAVEVDLAVLHRREVHDRAARHAPGCLGLDREREGEPVVAHGDVAFRRGLAVGDRRRPPDHGDLGRGGEGECAERRPGEDGSRCLGHGVTTPVRLRVHRSLRGRPTQGLESRSRRLPRTRWSRIVRLAHAQGPSQAPRGAARAVARPVRARRATSPPNARRPPRPPSSSRPAPGTGMGAARIVSRTSSA